MKIAELSRRTGVPVPTIKYYLRAGLLPSGERVNANQARYADLHVQRLRLVRILLSIGGLTVAQVGRLLAELDRPQPDMPAALGSASLPAALGTPPDPPMLAAALSTTDALIKRWGWNAGDGVPARHAIADVIRALWEMDLNVTDDLLDRYASAAVASVAADRALCDEASPVDTGANRAVASIVGDGLIAALRRLADREPGPDGAPQRPGP
ncbi:MerR family transcriptional regulator [Actinoplanes sp. TFC3]|uniref:MerR family transcriptional regulator n=1 Tax=Actinoplanes sp. TFC3 TaxID=1710355 RepID=UPI0008321300|nr:MerR family transcriptional regulator [Actinoplanes sp. TFC3]